MSNKVQQKCLPGCSHCWRNLNSALWGPVILNDMPFTVVGVPRRNLHMKGMILNFQITTIEVIHIAIDIKVPVYAKSCTSTPN